MLLTSWPVGDERRIPLGEARRGCQAWRARATSDATKAAILHNGGTATLLYGLSVRSGNTVIEGVQAMARVGIRRLAAAAAAAACGTAGGGLQ